MAEKEENDVSFESLLENLKKYNDAITDLVQFEEKNVDWFELFFQVVQSILWYAEELNAMVKVTPDVVTTSSSAPEKPGYTIEFPHTVGATSSCPYEVYYDNRVWLPCVILEAFPPPNSNLPTLEDQGTERRFDNDFLCRYTVGVIGYNVVEENVTAVRLRPFQAEELRSQLKTGESYHAVNPKTHSFTPCTFHSHSERETVLVTFESTSNAEPSSSEVAALTEAKEELVEVPLSHIFLGKVYKVLRNKQMAEEARRKKMEAVQKKQKEEASRVEAGAHQWKSVMDELGMDFSSGGKKIGGKRKRPH